VLCTLAGVSGFGGAHYRVSKTSDRLPSGTVYTGVMAVPGRVYIGDLPQRLTQVLSASELDAATCADAPGTSRWIAADSIRVGDRLLTSSMPTAHLVLDPPEDVGTLCAAWGVANPIAISGDVHQSSWHVASLDAPLVSSDPGRWSASPVAFGVWNVKVRLAARPGGPLPSGTVGASPAYDLAGSSASAVALTISRDWPTLTLVGGVAPSIRQLLAGMAQRWPHWRLGWEAEPDDLFIVVSRDDSPVAAAALRPATGDAQSAVLISVDVDRATRADGAALLDGLEALALDRGASAIRLDESSFLLSDVVPHERYGYRTGPPYAGDADVAVWVERALRPTAFDSAAVTRNSGVR